MTTVAVIQPYFFPYAGYYRLFAAADTVVMFDCVQFPRRGWVHRNRFSLANGSSDWLTLPLAKAERETLITELRFAPDAAPRLRAALARFPALARAARDGDPLIERMLAVDGDVTGYLCSLIEHTTAALGMPRPMLRSSSLDIDPALRAQDRVLAILDRLGAKRYVNPSGGRDLYDHRTFDAHRIELRFLVPFEGSMESVLSRVLEEGAEAVASDIRRQTTLVP